MATRQEIIARFQAGERGPEVEREILEALGFTAYQINGTGPVAGWRCPITGEILLVGRFLTDREAAWQLAKMLSGVNPGMTPLQLIREALERR